MKSALLSAVFGHTVIYTPDVHRDWLDLTRRKLTLPNLPRAFDGFRLAHISDIHMGTGMTEARLQHVVDLVNAEKPDMVAITGDFVTIGSVSRVAPMLINPLRRLRAIDGVFAVLGNHDHFTSATEVRQLIEQSRITELNNDVRSLRRDDTCLHIAGIDDMYFEKGRLDIVLDKLPDEGAAILLAHEPDTADDSAATGRFDLQLSGHSHGGQFNLPVIGLPYLPALGRKYPYGQYEINGMILYTSRGVGASPPAIRINCPPEVTLFTLSATG